MNYPAEAYSPSGELWWQLVIRPGTNRQPFGAEPKLASRLTFNTKVGEVFTIRHLREALEDEDGANTDEQLGRRLRKLRDYGWKVLSSRDEANLGQNEYRLEQLGGPIWLGKVQHANKAISAKTRRQVFDRDVRVSMI